MEEGTAASPLVNGVCRCAHRPMHLACQRELASKTPAHAGGNCAVCNSRYTNVHTTSKLELSDAGRRCVVVTVGTIVHNSGPFFLGGDPWRPAGGLDGFIDEFKFYGRALTTDEIQAAAGFALGGVEPAFIELGCMGCALDAAAATCAVGYHLCNTHDLHAGGYMVARSMGWATSNSHVWTAEEARAGGGQNASWSGSVPGAVKTGLGLCCALA